MTIKSIDANKKQAIINYLNVERVVSFSDNGDVDVEPFKDLSEEEGMELFDLILNNDEINSSIPFED